MTWQFDVNNPIAVAVDGIGEAFLGLANLLATNGACSYQESGDGLVAYGAGNVLTGGTSIWNSLVANEYSNTEAWFRQQMTGTTFEMIAQRSNLSASANEDDFRYKISPTGFTGGAPDANTAPTAADEEYLLGSAVSFGNISNYNLDLRWHAGCQDEAQDGFYPFYLFTTEQGSGAIRSFFMFDVIRRGVTGDSHPWVFYFPGGAAGALRAEIGITKGHCYRDYGGGSELFMADARGHSACDGAGTPLMPGNAPPQAGDNLARGEELRWGQPSIGFYKGISRNIAWKGTTGRTYPDTKDLATEDAMVYIDDILIPWPQGVTPL